MATGILGLPQDLLASADTSCYTVPPDTFTVLTVNVCNRNATPITVRIAVAASATPGNSEFIEFDSQIVANGVLERTGIVAQAGKQIVVRTSNNNVSVVCYGIETSTV